MSPLTAYLVAAILGLSLTGGIAKCWSISRRPGTNVKCVLALAVLLASWLTHVANVVLVSLIPVPTIFGQVISMVSFAMTVAAGVLATVGLQEYSRGKGQFKQGRIQAISALVLSGLLLVSEIALVVEARWNVFGTRSAPVGARVLVFQDQNFRFFAPGGRWTQVDTNSLDWKATAMFQRDRPRVSFVLVAREETREGYSVNDLTESATEALRAKFKEVKVIFRDETRLDWLPGYYLASQMSSEVGDGDQKLYFEHRLFFTNGWSYQFITWGRKQDRLTVSLDAHDLFRRFEILDYNRRPNRTNVTQRGNP
jgi:hypothetical protein